METHSPERAKYWFSRGVKDGLEGESWLQFKNVPAHWTAEDTASAKAYYELGFSEGDHRAHEYADLCREIREAENLQAFATDPSGARSILRELEEQRTRMETDRSGFKALDVRDDAHCLD